MWSLAADPRLCGEVMHELWAVCGCSIWLWLFWLTYRDVFIDMFVVNGRGMVSVFIFCFVVQYIKLRKSEMIIFLCNSSAAQ